MFDPKLKEALGRVQKPGRYTGGEPGSIYKEKDKVDVRFAFCFPDTYEVGMSFLGEKILYELLNSHENWWCERAFMPWLDMKAEMERLQLPLYTMESKDPLTAFDAVGFTLQYELSYTNILAMLDLAGIPFYSKDRDDRWPLIVAGGPCACNAEPIADFFDVIQLGEGENQLPAICAEIEKAKKEGISKKQLLLNIAKIPGVYIPAFYDVTYHEDGRVKAITPNEPGIPARITKAIIKDLNQFAPPTNFVVPTRSDRPATPPADRGQRWKGWKGSVPRSRCWHTDPVPPCSAGWRRAGAWGGTRSPPDRTGSHARSHAAPRCWRDPE